jgi:urease accessory protein
MALPDAVPLQNTSAVFAANRAVGRLEIVVARHGEQSRRSRVHEQGCLRARFPHPQAEALETMIVNTAGGIAGGDRHDIDVVLDDGVSLTVSTAAAEKIYRSLGPDARIAVKLGVGAGATLAWLPQETILFDRAGLARDIEVDLAERAGSLVLAEAVVFGRAAMGERVEAGRLFDRWRVRRAGRLIFAETVKLNCTIARTLGRSAVAAGATAVATVLIVPGDEAVVERVRALGTFAGEVGISSWNGFALVRLCARDGAALRCDLIAVLTAVRQIALPRLWLN